MSSGLILELLSCLPAAQNLCLCGGVVLNSVLNGKITREGGFDRVHIPNHPGDEGISIGCAAYVLGCDNACAFLLSSFQGKDWSTEEIEDALADFAPWIDVEDLTTQDPDSPGDTPLEVAADRAAAMVASGKVVAWFQGRSEFGPRALGHRSLLADPRDKDMVNRINLKVKMREDFRPFAPSVLEEFAGEWFDGLTGDGSPYMSLTVPAKPGKREQIPAVCHVDGSSRIQTVQQAANPLYHRLISAFHRATGVPMVLNTSFNIKGEPIVDSPEDALRSFLDSNGGMDALVLHNHVVTRKPFPLDEGNSQSELTLMDQLMPSVVGPFISEVSARSTGEVNTVRVMLGDGKWVQLDDDLQLAVLEAIESADGLSTVAELLQEMDASADQGEVVDALHVLHRKRLVSFQ
ncbi:Carbamoyltransferase-domain-containing protein [Tribonema minus]|uniref:Carbamoyltransferase-domain-containing protein n=1 Tax=Tribonema minus TaxID=303371 RepID=A0A835ZBM7_9STRA|nr:Carbamoyltransferase-domain-containing protein [Tribonema minus]